MNSVLQSSIDRQRPLLRGWLCAPLELLANDCRRAWSDRQAPEKSLLAGLSALPYCKYLSLLDHGARQITANASRNGMLQVHFGRDRSERPYLAEAMAGVTFSLSEAYISRNAHRPSLTAVQAVTGNDGKLLGYLGADFDLRELPATESIYRQPNHPWREFLDKSLGFWLGTSPGPGACV